MTGLGRRLAIGAGLGLLVVIGLMLVSDLSALKGTFATLSWGPFGGALCLSLVGYMLRVVKWELYLRALEIRVPLGPSVLCFFAGMVMSITPGKVGEVLKSFLLRQAFEVPVTRSAPIVVAERLTDLMALLLLTSLGVATSGYGWGVLIAGSVLVGGMMLVFAWDPLGQWVLKCCAKLPVIGRIAPRLEEARIAMRALMGRWVLLVTLALSVAAWGLEAVGTWLILGGLTDVVVTLGEATFVYAFSTVAGALTMLPGGLIATEGSMIALLELTMGVAPTGEVATVATLLIRFATLWFGVALGGLALWGFGRATKKASAL
ncbi:MAG: lysylphosphatidylglycerol synthase transmembrane domain-containing protein [Myxococcota bacterium]